MNIKFDSKTHLQDGKPVFPFAANVSFLVYLASIRRNEGPRDS